MSINILLQAKLCVHFFIINYYFLNLNVHTYLKQTLVIFDLTFPKRVFGVFPNMLKGNEYFLHDQFISSVK